MTVKIWPVLLLLAAGNDGQAPATTGSAVVPMEANAWAILYSPGMPARPSPQQSAGWYFDFPSAPGSVHYVLAAVNMVASKSVSTEIAITGTGAPTFEYALAPNNTCIYPAHVRLLLQQKGDDLSGVRAKQYYRWWSINAAYELAPGSTTLTAEISDHSQWLSVFGERADASAAAKAGFEQAMKNLGAVGFAFGGGCFFGHGVRVNGGSARFAVTSYAVK